MTANAFVVAYVFVRLESNKLTVNRTFRRINLRRHLVTEDRQRNRKAKTPFSMHSAHANGASHRESMLDIAIELARDTPDAEERRNASRNDCDA